MEFIQVDQITKSYGQTHILKGINWSVPAQTQWSIQGASGSGKSTLLHLLAGLDRPNTGRISVAGKTLGELSDTQLAEYRNQKVGVIFQFHYLLPSLNGLENILLPSRLGTFDVEAIKKRATFFADKIGLRHCLNKFPYQMSGGEQQRINILRALSLSPQLILCDEPTGNLDSQNSHLVMGLIRELAQEFKSTLIVVTHDSTVAALFPNHGKMRDGQLLV